MKRPAETPPHLSAAERGLFFVSAAFNWIVALAIAAPGTAAWRIVGMRPPDEPLFLHLFAALVAVFGVAYLWIALDASNKRALIIVAVIGKLSVFAVVFGDYLAGTVPAGLVLAACGDVVFAVLFLRFVHRHGDMTGRWTAEA